MPIDLKRALAHLVSRPSRPRYQSRTMHPDFLADDAACDRAENAGTRATMHRWQALPARVMQDTAGTVQVLRGPIVLASVLAVVVGATSLLH